MDNSIIDITPTDNGKELVCPESFDISLVSEVKSIFQQVLKESPEEITLSTELTQNVDTSALQLLIAFIQSAKKRGIRLKIYNHSESVIEASKVLGLDEELFIHS